MADIMSPEKRSQLMASISGKNTKPELKVRRAAHALGYRFRLHGAKLPGTPDLVFPKHRTVIFVHGCFWHRHGGCSKASTPTTRAQFWQAKFAANQERDARKAAALEAAGWKVRTIWECETKNADDLARRIDEALSPGVAGRG